MNAGDHVVGRQRVEHVERDRPQRAGERCEQVDVVAVPAAGDHRHEERVHALGGCRLEDLGHGLGGPRCIGAAAEADRDVLGAWRDARLAQRVVDRRRRRCA